MKKIFFSIAFGILFLSNVCCSFAKSDTFANTQQICKENVEETCKDYDDFLAFFFNNRNWKVSLDFFKVPSRLVREDGSKNDPLSDEFYK